VEALAPHKLYGFVDAAENYSVGRWCRDVDEALKEIGNEGRVPILVGGTGLYFKALTSGLAAVPPIPADVRTGVRDRLLHEGAPALHAELMRLDPATAQRITSNDRSRISRALEVVLATGRALSDWHREGLPPLIDPERAVKVFITCERKELVRRIEDRFDVMMKSAALGEVRQLAARRLDPTLPAMKAHGVPWLIRHLNSEISREEAVAGAVMDTRRYAKRQLTWFRNQMKDWVWAEPNQAFSAIRTHFQTRV
jgi:tRNA dimethylallyltransferase